MRTVLEIALRGFMFLKINGNTVCCLFIVHVRFLKELKSPERDATILPNSISSTFNYYERVLIGQRHFLRYGIFETSILQKLPIRK